MRPLGAVSRHQAGPTFGSKGAACGGRIRLDASHHAPDPRKPPDDDLSRRRAACGLPGLARFKALSYLVAEIAALDRRGRASLEAAGEAGGAVSGAAGRLAGAAGDGASANITG